MSNQQLSFKLVLSKKRDRVSPLAQAAIHLSELSGRLALEDRTLVSQRDQKPENVAEHSLMLAIIAPALAEAFFPGLDTNLVARFATIHDSVEAYVGDTPTHEISEPGLVAKVNLEALGLNQLKQDYKALPLFVDLVTKYEAQQVPEARFVRVLDKSMPALMHLINDGVILKNNFSRETVLENSAVRAKELRRDYPEYEALIQLRIELTELIAAEFLSKD